MASTDDGRLRSAAVPDPASAEIRVAFWNLQNLFDTTASPMAADFDFTPAFGWDNATLDARIRRLADELRRLFGGHGPDLLGICEVETPRVAERLMQAIGRSDYRLATGAPDDIAALDTALVYSDRIFECEASLTRGHCLHHRYRTHDLLEVHLRVRANNARLAVLVNHWPSWQHSRTETEPFRLTVASDCARIVNRLVKLPRCDYLQLGDSDVSLYRLNQVWNRNVLVMGDFNDDPWSRSVREILRSAFSEVVLDEPIRRVRSGLPSWRAYCGLQAPLFNAMPSLMTRPDQGTVWRPGAIPPAVLCDQFLCSRGLYSGAGGLMASRREDGVPDVAIVRQDSLTGSSGHPRPWRRDDPRGGSDHFPITMRLHTSRDTDVE